MSAICKLPLAGALIAVTIGALLLLAPRRYSPPSKQPKLRPLASANSILERRQEHRWPMPAWRLRTKLCCKHRSTRFELAEAGFEQC
jgi:hypothetical protein